jgi:hypothetical protein
LQIHLPNSSLVGPSTSLPARKAAHHLDRGDPPLAHLFQRVMGIADATTIVRCTPNDLKRGAG